MVVCFLETYYEFLTRSRKCLTGRLVLGNCLREVSFFTERGLSKIGGDQVLFLRSKGGLKDFFIKKTYIF